MTSAVLGGVPFNDGALQITMRPPTGVPSTEPRNGGWAIASIANAAYVEDAGAAVPATAVTLGGLAFTTDGALYITQSTTGTFADIGGHKVRSDGALLVKGGTPTIGTDPFIYGWAHDGPTRAAYIDGSFVLPLADLGSGAVNTAPLVGTGSATFTRATVAWTKLSTGLWRQVASGTARSCYIGLTTAVGVYGGYLAEGAGTQLVTPTASIRDMTDASWLKVTMTTAKTATGIDGTANSATTITATGASSTILQTLVAAASSRTYSCWMKRRTGTGTILIMQGATTLDVTALINSSTYTLVQLSASVLNSAFGIQINTSTDAVDVDFNQFEAGGFASTPMDSAGASRNADVLTFPFAGNANATAGSAYAEIMQLSSTTGSVINFAASGANATIFSVDATSCEINDGTTNVTKSGLGDVTTAVRKHATSWGGAGLSATGDGLTPATGVFDGAMSNTSIAIGCGTGGLANLYGTIKNVRIFQRQLPDGTLQAITT